MNSKKHVYGFLYKVSGLLGILLSMLCIAMGVFYFYGFVVSLLRPEEISVNVLSLFGNFLIYLIGSPLIFLWLAHLIVDVEVTDEGLRTKFIFKDYFISWNDILDVKSSRPFGMHIGEKASVVIVKKGLTPFHHIYGAIYGQVNQPAFLIWSRVSDYNELMRIISKHRKQK